jgi:hypothetical protein
MELVAWHYILKVTTLPFLIPKLTHHSVVKDSNKGRAGKDAQYKEKSHGASDRLNGQTSHPPHIPFLQVLLVIGNPHFCVDWLILENEAQWGMGVCRGAQ